MINFLIFVTWSAIAAVAIMSTIMLTVIFIYKLIMTIICNNKYFSECYVAYKAPALEDYFNDSLKVTDFGKTVTIQTKIPATWQENIISLQIELDNSYNVKSYSLKAEDIGDDINGNIKIIANLR